MREWAKPTSTLMLALGLAVFCFCVYLSNLPVNYTYDGMVYAASIEKENPHLSDFFHPHHLLYTFLGRLIFLWGRAHGATWDGLVALQFFDLMTGILGVLLTFHLLVRETKDRFVAFLSAAGLAFSFSYWYFSTTPGVRIFATVTPLLTWYVLTYLKNAPPAFGWIIGCAHGLAVLGHQTNLLLIPAFLGGIACVREKRVWERLRASFYYLVGLTVVVLGVYGFVGRYISYRKSYESWLWWVFSYFHVQKWGGHLQPAGFERGRFAMVQAFLANAFPFDSMTQYLTFGSVKLIFQYTLLLLVGILLLGFGRFWKNYRQIMWVSVLWLVAFVPFFIWWEPWNIEFWVSSTVPCWILMGTLVSELSKPMENPVLHLVNRGLGTILWTCLISLLFFYNFHGTIFRTADKSYGHQVLLGALDWKVRVDDLLVLDGLNTIPFYIDRYQKRDYLSLHSFLKKYRETEKKDVDPHPEKEIMLPLPTKADPWADLSNLFKSVWERHRKVWVLTETVDENDQSYKGLETILKLPDGQLSAFFNHYELKPVEYHGKVYFYELVQPEQPEVSPGSSNNEKNKRKEKADIHAKNKF